MHPNDCWCTTWTRTRLKTVGYQIDLWLITEKVSIVPWIILILKVSAYVFSSPPVVPTSRIVIVTWSQDQSRPPTKERRGLQCILSIRIKRAFIQTSQVRRKWQKNIVFWYTRHIKYGWRNVIFHFNNHLLPYRPNFISHCLFCGMTFAWCLSRHVSYFFLTKDNQHVGILRFVSRAQITKQF